MRRPLPWLKLLLLAGLTTLMLLGVHFYLMPLQANESPHPELIAPELRVHPLPPPLAQWSDPQHRDDYFDQIQTTKAGYLIWSQFPVRVYIGSAIAATGGSLPIWKASVETAVQEWGAYLPLVLVTEKQTADIIIEPLNPQERSHGRVRSAEASFDLYVDAQHKLAHRFTILVRPAQTGRYITAAVRHELGHALGIWGHSPVSTDALYFSQVRHPPSISARDVNTLKRIYQQPTRLGWSVLPPKAQTINQSDH